MGSDIALEKLIYASLFTFDSEGSLKPYLAESYTVSEDQKTIDFKIRQGVKWQDGEDFTMDDLIFTIESAAKSVEDFEEVAYVKGAAEYKDGQADSHQRCKRSRRKCAEIRADRAICTIYG